MFKILDEVEIAPGTQIFTGQDGTTQIPGPFPHSVTDDDVLSSRVRDSTGGSGGSGGSVKLLLGGGYSVSQETTTGGSESTRSDVREDERGGRREHPSEYYSIPMSEGSLGSEKMEVDS